MRVSARLRRDLRLQRAGKIWAIQSVARLQNIQHTDNPAGLSRVSEIDFNAVEERFLGQKRDQFLAIDEQDMVVDGSSRAEAHILNIDKTHFEPHFTFVPQMARMSAQEESSEPTGFRLRSEVEILEVICSPGLEPVAHKC